MTTPKRDLEDDALDEEEELIQSGRGRRISSLIVVVWSTTHASRELRWRTAQATAFPGVLVLRRRQGGCVAKAEAQDSHLDL